MGKQKDVVMQSLRPSQKLNYLTTPYGSTKHHLPRDRL